MDTKLLLCALGLLVGCAAPPRRVAPRRLLALPAPLEEPAEVERPAEAGRRHVALFLGAGIESRSRGGKQGPTFGLELRERVAERWSVAAGIESLASDTRRDLVFVAPFGYHPTERLKLVFGPVLERGHDEWNGGLRLGLGYELELVSAPWSLAPEAYLDLMEGGETVFLVGFEVARAF